MTFPGEGTDRPEPERHTASGATQGSLFPFQRVMESCEMRCSEDVAPA
jgi:hypothetical protein